MARKDKLKDFSLFSEAHSDEFSNTVIRKLLYSNKSNLYYSPFSWVLPIKAHYIYRIFKESKPFEDFL